MDIHFNAFWSEAHLSRGTENRLTAADIISAVGTFRTSRVTLAMSVDGGKADLALGRIGAFLLTRGRPIRDDKDGI